MAVKKGALAGAIKRAEDCAHGKGQALARAARQALYGTRYSAEVNAGTAPDQQTVGVGKRSVWQGPAQISSGAPVLRRNQP